MFSLFISYAFALSCVHTQKDFNCVQYVKNHDGDTITFNIKGVPDLIGKAITVRVYGIDTPEVNTKNKCEKERGKEAQFVVQKMMLNSKRIDLVNVQRDKYFRILAEVKVDGVFLKDVMIQKHLAYPYFGDTKRKINWCLK